jgi:hypothetical protein
VPDATAGVDGETVNHAGLLLDVRTLPELPPTQRPQKARHVRASSDRHRGEAYMEKVIDDLARTSPGGRNNALNHAAWTLGRWIAAGALEQTDVEDALYAAVTANGLAADDGERQCWATIRSGLSTGLAQDDQLGLTRHRRRPVEV